MTRFLPIAALALTSLTLAPTAFAACDITQTKCWVNGGKCNIQFKNKTGDSGGSDGDSNLNQTSSAQTITVKAKDSSNDKTGNKLNIVAGASKTMNIEKKAKKGFEYIQLESADFGPVNYSRMSCEEVQAVLNGNGTCKVFHRKNSGDKTGPPFRLGVQCDGGNIGN